MKIRQKITLWITAAGLMAGMICALIVFLELIEQPYELLDHELDSQARTLLTGVLPLASGCAPVDEAMLRSLGRLYWFKVYDQDGTLLYASPLTRFASLDLRETGRGYNVTATIPPGTVNLEQEPSGEVTFRVRVFRIPVSGRGYLVQVARPMEKFQEETRDLVVGLAIGLSLFALLLIVFGYLAAGRILRPISDITGLARKITDKTLDQRIPVGSSPDEIRELALALNRMFDRLDDSFHRRKMFMASGAHELKTPLALQRLFCEELLEREDLPPDLAPRIADQIRNQARMERLIRDLLELSALEMDEKPGTDRVDLAEICRDVVNEFAELIRARRIALHNGIEAVPPVTGSRERLQRMVINLLNNAVRYSLGEIRISLAGDRQNVVLEIWNSGHPIPVEERDLVFRQFYRVEKSRATRLGGSGLGLTIVRRIVRLHGGQVGFVDSPGGDGVTVRVVLPAAQSSADRGQ